MELLATGNEPLGSREWVSPRLCTLGWQLGCVLYTSFPGVTEMDEEKALEQGCSYRDQGQCSLLFCRAEVKSQGRCDQAGTSRCQCR